MSRLYDCYIRIENIPDLKEACNIAAAVADGTEISEDDFLFPHPGTQPPYSISGGRHVNLSGGISEKDWVDNLLQTMYKAMFEYRPVEVGMTYLEDLPVESYVSDEDIFNAVKAEQEAERKAEEETEDGR